MGTFIDPACLIKMAGYLPRSFLRFFFLPRLPLGPQKHVEKLGKYPATVYLDSTLGQ